eukprot:6467915-Pyramimonas_sp.AAC.1
MHTLAKRSTSPPAYSVSDSTAGGSSSGWASSSSKGLQRTQVGQEEAEKEEDEEVEASLEEP